MRTLFADAGYLIALLNERDPLRARAETVTAALRPFRLVTTQMVLIEVLNFMSRAGAGGRRLAAGMAQDFAMNPAVDIVPQTDEQFRAAVERYAARTDQTWSLTDCASFLVMEERNITEALAYDRDFEQAGFTALLR
jgi:predicted nucleic acid-binding protein